MSQLEDHGQGSEKSGEAPGFIRGLFEALFGRWNWQPPVWNLWLGQHLAAGSRYLISDPRRWVTLLFLLLALAGAGIWYRLRPKPAFAEYEVTAPALTEYDDKGISLIHPMRVVFSSSAAPLKQVEKRVTSGVELSPAIAGTWFWFSDKDLRFTPKNDWPVDQEFKVSMVQKRLLTAGLALEDYSFKFRTQPFSAKIAESQFYQDPLDPSLKKLVATVTFSHPVDAFQLEKRISFTAAKDAEYLGLSTEGRHFSVVYDKLKLNAHIHSASLGMPRDDTPMTVRVDKGVRAARGGNETPARLESVVVVPGRASLRFSGAQMTLVDNARFEPEQILLLTSSSPVAEKALAGKVQAWVLPVRSPRQEKEDTKPFRWDDATAVGTEILGQAQALTLTYVPSDGGGNTGHGFKFLAPPGRYVYVLVKENVAGTGGYISGKPYLATLRVSPYKAALSFLGQGALLSLSGDRKVGFMARDVERVEVEIGRVLPNQLQHIAPRMWDFQHPQLYDLEDQVVERFTSIRTYDSRQPGKPVYDSIDLKQYLQDKAQNRRGLFLLHVRQVQNGQKKAVVDDNEDSGDNDQNENGVGNLRTQDARLILVTDLGVIVKQAKDGTRDVFTQSINSGEPVSGARIEVLGANGLPVLAGVTDAGGHATLPKFRDLMRERTPLMILASKDSDFSFMPFRTTGRNLDFSRFDIGGVENANSSGQLSVYLFTDRGIYRPGETVHLGLITRTADWKASLAGMPIVVEITDTRGAIVSANSMKVSASGLDEIALTTQPSAPTGTWQAVAWVVKDDKRREMLGSTSFKVQEFEPDRMKVRLDLSDKQAEGWLTPNDVKARVEVAHLFGEPAGNRRVEGELNLSPVLPRFGRYPDHRFQIGEVINEPFHETLSAVVTDDKGHATLNLDLKRFAGRAYRVSVLIRAFEAEGGRSVAAQNSAIVADVPYLVGVKPDGDLSYVTRGSQRAAQWLAVNQQLTPVGADGLSLEWVQRKYVSVLTLQQNRTYKYVSQMKETVRDSHPVRVAVGGSNIILPTQEPGEFILILRNGNGAELNRLNYTVAGNANLSRSLERNAELQIQLDKPAYAGGETIAVSIRAPYTGAGIITIERDRVFHYQWFRTTTTSSVQKITLPREFEGNGYVSVQFLRDPASDEIFMSPLSYGVAPFSANLAARTEKLTLNVPREVKPGTVLTIRVAPGEASRLAVFAVDEGILQVARYKTPDPLSWFFQKRMLQVETSQILDLILPEFKRFVALAAAGGDADGGFARQLNPFAKKRRPPVAWWSGLIEAGPAGKELRYTVPDYFNGRLRIMAIAVNPGRIGVAEAATEVKGDFILTPNVPTMVAPGDEFIVSVGVFNNTSGQDPIRIEVQPSPFLTPAGPVRAELAIAGKKEAAAEFRFKANNSLGSAALTFVATRGRSQARIEESISIRPAIAYRTQITLGRFDGASVTVPLTRNMFSEKRTVETSVSALPLVWGQGLIAYLDSYPYLCTEQLVSKGMAAMLLAERPEFGTSRSLDPQPLASALAMLQSRENEQGGVGLWAASPETAEFPTLYAAHFLLEARDHHQQVPAALVSSLNDWLSRFAATPANSLAAARMRAYAVYLLARQGIRPVAALANVEQELSHRYEKAWPTDLAAAYLAGTYRLMQRNNDADRIFRGVVWAQQKNNWENGNSDDLYYDPVTHDAQVLDILARHFPARLNSVPASVLEGIGRAIGGNQINSLSAAYTLLALDGYAKVAGSTQKFRISQIARDGREQALAVPAGVMPKVSLAQGTAKVQFTRDGSLASYYVLAESGFDTAQPTAAASQGVEIIRDFTDLKGNAITRVQMGEDFLVRLRLRSTKADVVRQVAVVDVLPGGVEAMLEIRAPADTANAATDPAVMRGAIAVATLPIGVPGKSTWVPDHVDVREDRVVFYGSISRDTGTFIYRVRASSAGLFQVPPAFAEGMYNRTVSGWSPAGKLEVVKP